jgi:hypothetical protein
VHSAAPTPQQREPERRAAPSQPTASSTKSNEQRAAEWASWFVDEVHQCRTVGFVQALQEEHSATLDKLQAFPELAKRAQRAIDDKLASL